MKRRMKCLIYPDKTFYQKVFSIALSIALQNLITFGVNLTDTIMVGMLGENELAAASLANQFISVFQTLVMGMSMGASVLLARYWGMKKLDTLKEVVVIQTWITLGIGILFSLGTFLWPGGIMRIFTEEKEVIAPGITFLRYSVFTYLFQAASISSTIVLRNIQREKIPMLASIGAFVINIFGNYGFIFGKFGLPELGIGGAAVSTFLVRLFECVIICGYLLAVDQQIHIRIKDFFMKTTIFREYLRVGLPVMVSDLFLALANSVVMMIIGRMGTAFVAANAVASVVINMANILIQGIGQASSIVTGNTLGEGKKQEAQQQGYAFFGLGAALGIVMGIVIVMISGIIIEVYNLSENTAQIARQLLYAVALIHVFQSANSILMKGVLRGGGDTKILMITDSIFLWIVAIPLGSVMGLILHAPAFWVYFCLKCDNIFKCVWCVGRLHGGKWIKPVALQEH